MSESSPTCFPTLKADAVGRCAPVGKVTLGFERPAKGYAILNVATGRIQAELTGKGTYSALPATGTVAVVSYSPAGAAGGTTFTAVDLRTGRKRELLSIGSKASPFRVHLRLQGRQLLVGTEAETAGKVTQHVVDVSTGKAARRQVTPQQAESPPVIRKR